MYFLSVLTAYRLVNVLPEKVGVGLFTHSGLAIWGCHRWGKFHYVIDTNQEKALWQLSVTDFRNRPNMAGGRNLRKHRKPFSRFESKMIEVAMSPSPEFEKMLSGKKMHCSIDL